MHKIRALCLLIRTETLQNATAGRRRKRFNKRGYERLLGEMAESPAISCKS